MYAPETCSIRQGEIQRLIPHLCQDLECHNLLGSFACLYTWCSDAPRDMSWHTWLDFPFDRHHPVILLGHLV